MKGVILIAFLWICFSQVCGNFRSCNSGSEPNRVGISYQLSRRSVPIPGSFNASFELQLDTTIDDDVKVKVEVRRPVLWWTVRVPCVGFGQGVGSCTYTDICAMLSNSEAMCNGQPCRCPLAPGTYTFPNRQISTNRLPYAIRRVARNTVFDVKLEFISKSTGQVLSCLRTSVGTIRV